MEFTVSNYFETPIYTSLKKEWVNKYNKLLEQGKTPADAKRLIMKEINTLKIPLGTLNIRKS